MSVLQKYKRLPDALFVVASTLSPEDGDVRTDEDLNLSAGNESFRLGVTGNK